MGAVDVNAIPRRRQARCEQCGETVDVQAFGVAQHGEGWFVNRRGGGTNAVALPERHPRWLCRFCLDARKRGHSWNQLELF